ncbi:Uu.00g121040.m01.CDS01 [Anthostomella pinea]|uniref:Uu.00g121040.m01.CDS01 n=1 Tax=Anthostomella pinea TaxID=933095 RepID=A0AAI8YH66_9PEZI|nr:Uu.00g121040.m01.CDS01 [Anthostomella pinea]
MATTTEASLNERLLTAKCSRRACLAALRGGEVEQALGDPVYRLCLIRGIRYHYGLGEELRGTLPVFNRALNARSIMSNVIASFEGCPDDEVPYCVWHPETALQETYRELARRYPKMVYQVGRACAVAGYTQLYTQLYNELDILPDVHIAQEARKCGNLAIFEDIMSWTVRYSIMNDYTLSTNLDKPHSAHLNGDTCARWILDVKQGFKDADCEYEEEDGKLVSMGVWDEQGYDDNMF